MAIQDSNTNIQGVLKTRDEFNKLYETDLNPWKQDGMGEYEHYNFLSRLGIVSMLKTVPGKVTEVGCGLGYALDTISYHIPNREYTGVDISDVAISKARIMFPHIKYRVADVTMEEVKDDVIILNEVLWYVLRDIDNVLDNCMCEHLIINHAFLHEQKFDRDIIDGWNGLLAHLLMRDYTIVHAKYDVGGKPFMNGIVLCKKNM